MNYKYELNDYQMKVRELSEKTEAVKKQEEKLKKHIEEEIINNDYNYEDVQAICQNCEYSIFYPILNVRDDYKKKAEKFIQYCDEDEDMIRHEYILVNKEGIEIKIIETAYYDAASFRDRDRRQKNNHYSNISVSQTCKRRDKKFLVSIVDYKVVLIEGEKYLKFSKFFDSNNVLKEIWKNTIIKIGEDVECFDEDQETWDKEASLKLHEFFMKYNIEENENNSLQNICKNTDDIELSKGNKIILIKKEIKNDSILYDGTVNYMDTFDILFHIDAQYMILHISVLKINDKKKKIIDETKIVYRLPNEDINQKEIPLLKIIGLMD